MKLIPFTTVIVALLSACQSDSSSQQTNLIPPGVHKVVVEEVLQTPNYTYLRVKEADAEQWLAVPKAVASIGETYYYQGGLLMTDFPSKDLNRTFKEVYFLDQISTTPEIKKAVIPERHPHLQETETPVIHKGVVQEVLQTAKYTYLRVKEGEVELWLAITKMQAAAGETYYYQGGLPMKDFVSKELNRTFPEVFFLDNISTTPDMGGGSADHGHPHSSPHTNDPSASGQHVNPNSQMEKVAVKVEHSKEEISIAELFKNKKLYAGKTVKVKGEVVKFTEEILGKNWVHIQDGTSDKSGKYDLTITTNTVVRRTDIIVFEGVISLDKDFGFGYQYDVIMEDAKVVK